MGGRNDGKIMVSGARIYPFPTLRDMIMTVGDLTSKYSVACFSVLLLILVRKVLILFIEQRQSKWHWLLSNLLILVVREIFDKCKWDISVSSDSFML
jgi:hypothetical protein